jgi:thiol-disulfide isomerase/thioredoxin
MKKLFSMAVMALLALTAQAQDVPYSLTGTVEDTTTFVSIAPNMDAEKSIKIPVANGKFKSDGQLPRNAIVTLNSPNHPQVAFVNDLTPVTVNLIKRKVTGSALNVQFTDFQKSLYKQNQKINEATVKLGELRKEPRTVENVTKVETMEKQINEMEEKRNSDIQQYCKKHTDDVSPAYFIKQYTYLFTYKQLQSVVATNAAYYNSPLLDDAKTRLQAMEVRHPGQPFTDLTLQDLNGKTVKLSQWVGRGHYVLVDFWASWCGPCLMEMPNVVEAYNRYHVSKGFDVVGVSLDIHESDWQNAVKNQGMAWPQMSDLKGWDSKACESYGVKTIPCNVLVDPKGYIVDVDLRGMRLQNKLMEIFGY